MPWKLRTTALRLCACAPVQRVPLPHPQTWQVGGKQPDGRRIDPPSWSFSSASRTPVEAGGHSPGPVYETPAAIGPQPNGQIPNAPKFSISVVTREIRSKLYLNQELQKGAEPAVPTPGPAGPYEPTVPIGGKEVSARIKTSPRMAFSRYPRWAQLEREARQNTVPGPGAYG